MFFYVSDFSNYQIPGRGVMFLIHLIKSNGRLYVPVSVRTVDLGVIDKFHCPFDCIHRTKECLVDLKDPAQVIDKSNT